MRRRPLTKLTTTTLVIAAMLWLPGDTAGQIDISGQLDLVGMARSDTLGLNKAFRGDSPFNPVRLRLFARHWVTDRIGIFTELLWDSGSDPRVNGAYVVINELAGQSWLNARLGLAPNLIGSNGLRSTYFNSNPLVGVPLVWQYRTNLDPNGAATASTLETTAGEPGRGLPILYDSCWNIQWELLGELGSFEYSLGMTPGSLSNPIKSMYVPGSTWMARVGWVPIPSTRLGVSGAHGPYLSEPTRDGGGALPYSQDPSDFKQSLVGADLEYQGGPLVVTSEVYRTRYEAPLIEDDLEAWGGYAELRFDFLPGWYLAGRVGGLFFGDIETDAASGARAPWDHDTRRTEVALGYRLAREVLVKLDWQRTTVPDDDFVQNLFAVQLSSVF
jgi:hypothetical protein